MMRRAQLEVCVDTAAGLEACLWSGVDRIELCSALTVGGLTPSSGFMMLAGSLSRHAASSVPSSIEDLDASCEVRSKTRVMAMIRPRAGNFCFSEAETEAMCADIEAAREAGLSGVVLGAATIAGTLDLPVLRRLCQAASGMGLTLHRVIDLLDDPLLAVEQAIDLGFDRILTSGGAVGVADGLLQLTVMQKYAAGRIQIMAGAGLSPALAKLIRSETGIEAFHASCRRGGLSDDRLMAFGFGGQEGETERALIEEFKRALDSVE